MRQCLGQAIGTAFLQDGFSQQSIEIVAAELGVAARRQHLKHALLQAQQREIEGAAAKIVDGIETFGGAIQPVGQSRRCRFVDKAQHFQPGGACSIASRRTGGIVEIGRHRDHRTTDFPIQRHFGAALAGAQDVGRNLDRRQLPTGDVEADHVLLAAAFDDGERQNARHAMQVGPAPPHEALDRGYDVATLDRRPGQRLVANERRATGTIGDDRRNQRFAGLIPQRFRLAVASNGDDGVGRAQIDADRHPALVGMRQWRLAGLMNVEQHQDRSSRLRRRRASSISFSR